jgi:dUTP pyrophosphatase
MAEIKIKFLPHYVGDKPGYAREGDAGFDIRAAIEAPVFVPWGGREHVPAGVKLAIPEGYYLQLCSRSGLYKNHGVRVGQGIGVIDAGYRGELGVMLTCDFRQGYWLQPGERIAQGVLIKFETAGFDEVDELPPSERGEGGFGSTGKVEIAVADEAPAVVVPTDLAIAEPQPEPVVPPADEVVLADKEGVLRRPHRKKAA